MSKFENYQLSKSLETNISTIKEIFNNDNTLIHRSFVSQQDTNLRYSIFFVDGIISSDIINENIILPIVTSSMQKNSFSLIDQLQYQIILSHNIAKTNNVTRIVDAILSGDTALFIEGVSEALLIDTKKYEARSIEEPVSEKVVSGPREGFTECIMTNISMLRRKLRTHDLKFEYTVLGEKSRTRACICYIEGVANKRILKELQQRLDTFHLDGVLDTNYVQEYIKDAPLSLFKTTGNTERPDIVAAKLLEGRIALILDGSPVVLTVPFLFIEHFQSNEDYYMNFYFASIGRVLRIMSFFISISTPAIYLALVTFHQEMIPTQLLLSITAAREGVPFPTVFELTMLLVVFELLRESGIRMPAQMGQALSIVGALVLGQAAVEARLVEAPIVIVVALTAIAGLMIPAIKQASIILRFLFLFAAAMLGLYGYIFSIAALLIGLFSLNSFGIPYMSNLTDLHLEELKDTAIRAPWWYMTYRPKLLTRNKKRQSSGGRK